MTSLVHSRPPIEPTSEVVRILEEYLEELQAGARPDPENLALRCPEWAEPLKACLASLDFLQQAALSLQGAAEASQPVSADHLSEVGGPRACSRTAR
jgi:hypothetical protein